MAQREQDYDREPYIVLQMLCDISGKCTKLIGVLMLIYYLDVTGITTNVRFVKRSYVIFLLKYFASLAY